MGKKLSRSTYPSNHSSDDFECFGPPATMDGQFEGTMICDMGCFKQDDVDSNKYYHGAVVQSKKTKQWFAYFEYGRVGATNPQYQFIECLDKSDAEYEYTKQLMSKNVKRGMWENHSALGKRLIAKPGKDVYLVRPQSTRSTGLPDAKTVTSDEGLKKTVSVKKSTKKKVVNVDTNTMKLMRDLSVATIKYTKASMADAAIPTQIAINDGRLILSEALKRVSVVGSNIDDQVNDKELKSLTSEIYSRIPKKKNRGDSPDSWILSQNNIGLWRQDLDAYESALYSADLGSIETDDPYGGMPITMDYLPSSDKVGEFIRSWMPNATLNKHHSIGSMKIKNVWRVNRQGDSNKITKAQDKIIERNWQHTEIPLNQPKQRSDLSRSELKKHLKSGTYMMFHGTRSVNVSGILRESLRLPNQLVGVVTNGAMFGQGLYWADDWKKSAGYTSMAGSYWSRGSGSISGRGAFMFIADVVIGRTFVADGPRGFTKPPQGYHSVMGKAGHSRVQNNEFITYERDTNSLKYLVEFEA